MAEWKLSCRSRLQDEDSWEQPPSDFDMPVEPENRWTRVKTRTKEFLETVTMNGIMQICGARLWLRRLAWLSYLILCTVYSLMQCYNVYNEYMKYPKAVAVQLQTERPAKFPAVTLCSLNPINNEEALRNDSVYGAFIDVQEQNSVAECAGLKNVSDDPLADDICEENCDFELQTYDYYDLSNDTNNDSSTTAFSTGTSQASSTSTTLLSQTPNSTAEPADESALMHIDDALLRLQCNFIYQYQMMQEPLNISIFATDNGTKSYVTSELVRVVGDLKFCPQIELWNAQAVTIRYNRACKKEVYEDFLGNYTGINIVYEETYISPTEMKVSCASGTYTPLEIWLELEKDEMSEKRVQSLISRSRTFDLSDLRGRFAPDRDVAEKTARKREDFVQVCSIDNVHCNYKLFHPYTTKDMGVCYTFNSPHLVKESSPSVSIEDRRKNFKPRASYKTGPQSGLSLTLNLHAASYLSLLSPWSGLRVVLHEPWQAPFPADEGFNLAAGLSHSIAVTKTVMQRIGPPHGQCSDTNTLMFDYSEALCNKLCIEREFRRRCNCTVNEGPAFDSLAKEEEFKAKKFEKCDAFDRFQGLCMQVVTFMATTEIFNCICYPACKEVRYSALISSTNVNHEFLKIVQNIKKFPMGEDLCGDLNSTVRLQIYLASSSYEEIDESPAYTWTTLISNLGGNLGFIGVSLITFFDVVYYLFDVFLILVWPRCYDVSEGVTKSVAPVKKIPKKIIILAGPP
ncbi:uncharacterized protein LOC108678058 [Hyalella azteca]|uniref:Uncharacterized protein LOC108678058 n=1 Tax=Hyalella azteca TaxID=294128 RepID=A0A8B7P9N0_HYAAZ|nr:uncharacterized protein LOC108678058 [Hyalella azteca]